MNDPTSFDKAIAISPGADGSFTAGLSDRWWVGGGPNGGYVAAIILNAMRRVAAEAAPGQPPRSLTVHFLSAPEPGEVGISVAVERTGRNTSFLSAGMTQGGEVQARAMAVFSASRDGVAFETAGMPASPPPEEGEEFDTGLAPVEVFARFRVIPSLGEPPFTSGSKAESAGWIRPREDRPLDPELAATILDVWFPAPYILLDRPVAAPTLEYTVHFPRVLGNGVAGQPDWMLLHVIALEGTEGHFTEDAELWTRDGTLLARSRQIALVREPGG